MCGASDDISANKRRAFSPPESAPIRVFRPLLAEAETPEVSTKPLRWIAASATAKFDERGCVEVELFRLMLGEIADPQLCRTAPAARPGARGGRREA